MLNQELHQSESSSPQALGTIPTFKEFIHGSDSSAVSVLRHRETHAASRERRNNVRAISYTKAVATTTSGVTTTVQAPQMTSFRAVVTAKAAGWTWFDLWIGIDTIKDWLGRSILLELVSSEIDPETGAEKGTIKGYARKVQRTGDEVKYECDFKVPGGFRDVGAVLVENEHHKEMFIQDIVVDGFDDGPVTVSCSSWVHSKYDNPQKRVFFTNKLFLPSQTPSGLKKLREEELLNLRGNGQGQRKSSDRIYDYDVYNDLGNPDSSSDQKRPVLGGKEHPYPRRCRTGGPPCKTDPESEKRSSSIYVPRDEAFSEIKNLSFYTNAVYSVLHAVLPALETVVDSDVAFNDMKDIDKLFTRFKFPSLQGKLSLKDYLTRLINSILHFEIPDAKKRDSFFWCKDEEFARQTLAGVNPNAIQLVTEWPMKSKLDPAIYGPPESAITTELIENTLNGIMTVDEALKQKKLFVLDYHDLLLPYVRKVRQLKCTTLYGSRTLFFYTSEGTLMPLAIELTRPQIDGNEQWKEVFTPAANDSSTSDWLWQLAKSHVRAHDSGYHELVSHWLRTHASTEPYIIATNRQLSAMHPIYKLLHPHFRYTMAINVIARGNLINSKGIIETTFSPAKYSMEISSVAYDQQWQFDLQGLPKDLISRGMAVEDPTAPHGLKLTIDDYPFANDGLLIWDTLKGWFSDYINHYYPNPSLVESDEELQAWWTEIRTVGHGDKKDESWWPQLKSSTDLIEIVTTIAWVASGHHAAVNFGQYAYGGYFPNRPTIARTKMPVEDPTEKETKQFVEKPGLTLMQCFPSQLQAGKVMAVLDILSNHSPDEDYLGENPDASWKEDAVVNAAFERFYGRLKEMESTMDARNNDVRLKNRNGEGVLPYELLKPFSTPGVTGKGVPYSISI